MAKQTHLKVNGVWKPLKSVWVNIGGVWKKDVMPKLNVNGTYKECMKYSLFPPYIYLSGEIGEELEYYGSSSGSLTFLSDTMKLSANYFYFYDPASLRTVDMIDITDYNTLTVKLGDYSIDNKFYVGIMAYKMIADSDRDFIAFTSVEGYSSGSSLTLTVDISSASGSFYIASALLGRSNYYTNEVNISEISLQ